MRNPYHGGPSVWANNWIGIPDFVTSVEKNNEIPNKYSLDQNYPNPFNPITNINYSIKNSGHVKLTVYNTLGQKVIDLVDENQSAGSYRISFNATELASGIYLYSIKSGEFYSTKKMILLK